ncbi:MAG: hypothetical protein KF814_02200 [Nitrospiraceae bacterium]|nr:hypothetical protein [Nitrospiraceae bacterium]
MRLVLLGTTVLFAQGCDNAADNRPLYQSREECLREWNAPDCEPAPSGSSHASIRYHGPQGGYTIDPDGRARRTGEELRNVPRNSRASGIVRGGFGQSSRHFSGAHS